MNKKRNATAIKTPTTGKVGKTTNVLVPSFDYDLGVVFLLTQTDVLVSKNSCGLITECRLT